LKEVVNADGKMSSEPIKKESNGADVEMKLEGNTTAFNGLKEDDDNTPAVKDAENKETL
jgi:hypothetical protein